MAIVTESKHEQLDTETISEYIREPKVRKPQTRSYGQDLLNSASEVMSVARAIKSAVVPAQSNQGNQANLSIEPEDQSGLSPLPIMVEEVDRLKPDVLETLWPGVQHDFSHSVNVKRTPSYYLTLGFMGGAVIALIVVWSFSIISSLFVSYGKQSTAFNSSKLNNVPASEESSANTALRKPLVSTYEVQAGDTLAAIALSNYKHVSPRLLDEICKANNLTDPNVLILGQKLVLPEYHY